MNDDDNTMFDFTDATVIEEPDVPKRRGRPPKNPAGDAVKLDGEASDSPKRGRPRKQKDLAGIEQILLSTHMMLAALIECPELVLAEQEAKTLATAIANVTEYYKIHIDGKTSALVTLLYTAGILYGPRALTIYRRTHRRGSTPDAS